MADITGIADLLAEIESAFSDDPRVKELLTITAKAAYVMGELGLE